MDALAIDFGGVVLQPVQAGFVRSPVVLLDPVTNQFLQVRQVGALIPITTRNLIGVPRFTQPGAQISKDVVADVDAKRGYRHGGQTVTAVERLEPSLSTSIGQAERTLAA